MRKTPANSIWWDYRHTMSHNAIFNYIVGNRGGGKSYGFKEMCIEDFIKDGSEFVYVRRYKTEFKNIKNYFKDIEEKYPQLKLEVKGMNFFCNDKPMGYGIALSTAHKAKSTSFHKVKKMGFDEFIIDKGGHNRYLPNEVELYLGLVESVFRQRTPSLWFFGNAISITNPYFSYFDISVPTNKKKIYNKNGVLIQFVEDANYIEMKKNTPLYKILEGTAFAQYSVENVFLRDRADFIIDTPQKMNYHFTIKSCGEHYGVWHAFDDGFLYVSKKYDPSNKLVYVTRIDEHTPNTMLLKGTGKSVVIKDFIKNYKDGLVRFDSVQTQNIVMDAVKNSF